MRIVTRTPEGQPLACRVCGKTTLVLVSDPPRDAVCPNCGFHAWLVPRNDEQLFAIDVAASDVSDVVDRIRGCESKRLIAATLVDGLSRLLIPDRVVVWGRDGRSANGRRVVQIARRGGNGEPGFACEIITQRKSLVRRSVLSDGLRLMFGAPMAPYSAQQPIGAIEVSYDCELAQDSQDAISRVVSSFAVVASAKQLASE